MSALAVRWYATGKADACEGAHRRGAGAVPQLHRVPLQQVHLPLDLDLAPDTTRNRGTARQLSGGRTQHDRRTTP